VEDYTMPELLLHGCTPEPLMLYPKALGILKFVADQTRAKARETCPVDVVLLPSTFDEDTLTSFFCKNVD
jgi:CRISPR-associated protein Csx17